MSDTEPTHIADYERAMRLLRESNEYAEHPWNCKGKGVMKEDCTCGLEAVDEMVDKEIQRWQAGCDHSYVHEAGDLVWCKRCYWHGKESELLIDGADDAR